jgi:hypothetical protein
MINRLFKRNLKVFENSYKFLYIYLLLLDTSCLKLNHDLQVNLIPFQKDSYACYKIFANETISGSYKWLEILLESFQYHVRNKLCHHFAKL